MCKRIISIALLICVFLSAFTSCNNNKGGVDEIIFDKTELELEVGEKTTIGVEIVPEELNRAVLKWQSSNPDVAKVIEGMVIGVAEGEAVISATSVNGKYAVCAVTVTLPENKENDSTEEMREFITQFIEEIVVYQFHVVIRLKTGLGVLDELDTAVEVKRKDVYEYCGSRTMAV